MTRWLLYPSKFEPITPTANPAAPAQWFGPLCEPRRIAIAAAVLATSGCALVPPPIVALPTTPAWGWHVALSQPVAGKRPFRSDAVLPPRPPAPAPTGWQTALYEPTRGQRRAVQGLCIAIPPQPAQVIVAAPQGWRRPLSEPYILSQSVASRPARVVSPVFSFKPPAAPPPAPAMAFYSQLSYPAFAKVKWPNASIQWMPWYQPLPPIVIPPLWNPQVPASATWTDQTGASEIWTPQLPGSTTWTDQITET